MNNKGLFIATAGFISFGAVFAALDMLFLYDICFAFAIATAVALGYSFLREYMGSDLGEANSLSRLFVTSAEYSLILMWVLIPFVVPPVYSVFLLLWLIFSIFTAISLALGI